MTMREGERIYSPAGRLLATGERLEQPGLVRALEVVAAEGGRSPALDAALLELMAERGGLVTADDLRRYEPRWGEPIRTKYARRHPLQPPCPEQPPARAFRIDRV